jgi:RimJ/RimL family protein N-acetyltransferase
VGSIGLHLQTDILRKNAEIGYWLAEDYWGKGIVTDAIHQIVKYGFENLDIVRIFARIYGTNIPSQKVVEKCGFKLEGKYDKTLFKNGEFLDELIYAIRK